MSHLTIRPLRLGVWALVVLSGCGGGPSDDEADRPPSAPYPGRFSDLPLWDDGLSEMSYYDAVETIYGEPRHYTRTLLFNREWLDPTDRVKADEPDPRRGDIPVFKLNIVEQIPTENYNYRFMATVFLDRRTLRPQKLAVSSQEWCGTTYKQMQWLENETRFIGFSYFGGEADRQWSLPPSPVIYPIEALFVIARAAAAAERDMDLRLVGPLRTTHLRKPVPVTATLRMKQGQRTIRVPFGRFQVRTVAVAAGDAEYTFDVESAAPYRLIRHRSSDGSSMSLRFVERRAYWDRSNRSGFHRKGDAP